MHSRRRSPGGAQWVAVRMGCLAAMALAVVACGSDSTESADRPSAVTRAVLDGNSVVLSVDDTEKNVDLAYLETPYSTGGPADSCLAQESAAELRRALPPDATVTYEQAESGVLLYDARGQLVNASLIQAGVAIIAAGFENSTDVPAPILERARTDQVGLYGADYSCTASAVLARADMGGACSIDGSAQVGLSASSSPTVTSATTQTTISSTAPTTTTSAADLTVQLAAADARWNELARLSTWIDQSRTSIAWRALSTTQRTTCQDEVNLALRALLHDRAALAQDLSEAQAHEAEEARLAEEQRKAAEAEAARIAEEQRRAAEAAEAARVAEEQRQAAEAARAAEEQRIAEEAEASRSSEAARAEQAAEEEQSQSGSNQSRTDNSGNSGSSSGSSGSSSNGDLSGYTGPRCYAPGGKTWRPC